jgi:hypothetical protein
LKPVRYVNLVVLADEIERDLAHRSGLPDTGVAEQDVDVPGEGPFDLARLEDVELLDPQGRQAKTTRPSLVASRPGDVPPGLQNSPTVSLFMPKSAEVQ